MKTKDKTIKRIGIDARFYGPIVSKGIGRYVQEVTDNIIRQDADNEYVIFLAKHNFDEFNLEEVLDHNQSEINKRRVKKVLVDIRWYTLAEQVLMPYYIFKEHVDLMHFPHFNVPVFTPTKFVVTIHDLILTKFPTVRASTLGPFFYRLKNFFYKAVIWVAVRRAKKIIAVAEFTKNDLIKQFNVKSEKIEVTYEGVANLAKGRDSLFTEKTDGDKTLDDYHIKNRFLLYVGNAYPHKNLDKLLEVFNNLRRRDGFSDIRLVMVGKEDYFYKHVKDYARELGLYKDDRLDSAVIFPGYVPDAKLEVLYQRAIAYVFPSLYEGFGLPPLEAMAKGCPVASSNESSMPELLGEAAIYFNPEDAQGMEERLFKIIQDSDLRKNLIEKGYKQAKKYDWWECARETLSIYQKVLD